MLSQNNDSFDLLTTEVIKENLCTHCGTCAGLSENIELKETNFGPIPYKKDYNFDIEDPLVYNACPGKELIISKLKKIYLKILKKTG